MDDLHRAIRLHHYAITLRAEQDAAYLGISRTEIALVVLALTPGAFYKSMGAEKAPGRWQGVYRPHWRDSAGRSIQLYVKLQIGHQGLAVVISASADALLRLIRTNPESTRVLAEWRSVDIPVRHEPGAGCQEQ